MTDSTNLTTYTYDKQNQFTREDNQAAGKTWVWTYDDAGNITSRKEYAYTTGTLGTVLDTVNYTYGNSNWGDLLTAYDGQAITHDGIGNPLTDGTWTYTWEHGRELSTMSGGGTTWTYTYDANGMRTKRTNGSTTYSYVYNGGSLSQMTVGSNTLNFAYDASGTPMAVTYNGTNYYYVTNLQGDVVAILNSSGTSVVTYTYDAWGKLLSTSGSMASTLGVHNPLRYRSYVYDTDTELYYLQSRYYIPDTGRFLNADTFTSTGQGPLGNNMFTYCLNNPLYYSDASGKFALSSLLGAMAGGAVAGALIGAVSYLSNSGINGTELTTAGFLGAVGIGAVNGAIGGAAGTIPTAKGLLSVITGVVSGIYSGFVTEGSLVQKIGTGLVTGVIAAGSTYVGSSIDTDNLSAGATAFANFSTTLAVGAPAEIAIGAAQQMINNDTSSVPTSPIHRCMPRNYVACLGV